MTDSVTTTECDFNNCGRTGKLKLGYCDTHYNQNRRYGKMYPIRPPKGSCKFDSCGKPHVAKGYCQGHYNQLRFTGSVRPILVDARPTECSQDDCDGVVYATGLCSVHYNFYRKCVRYGITPKTFYEILKKQEGSCAVCRSNVPTKKGWHIDHDHKCCDSGSSCGKCVRGILCGLCNTLLGFCSDNKSILQNAIKYLERRENVKY